MLFETWPIETFQFHKVVKLQGAACGKNLDALFWESRPAVGKVMNGAKRAIELNQKLYDQAVKGNENYDVKSIMKSEGMTDTNEAFDRAVQSAHHEIDQKFVDQLNEMGYRRGGRKFTIEDLRDFRNNSSYGKPSMDRDYGLNEDKIRELTDQLSKAKPGSPEAQEIAKQIASEHARTKITVDPDKYASHLRRGITETNAQLDKLRSQLENVPDSSAEANRINAEIERLSGRPAQLKQELNQIEGQASRIKDSYMKDLQTRLDNATPGSPEARRLTSEISDAKIRYAGKTDIELSPSRWHDGAEGLYKRTFNDVTRTDPEKAFQALTHSKHKEAYQDRNVLR